MKLNTIAGQSIEISDSIFARDYNESLVHQVAVSYLAGGRQGSSTQKSRSEVSGGGRKPWRQKGTGRSRAGTIRSPIWRGGGVTFASKDQDHSQKVNRKMYRAAMQVIWSQLIRQDRLLLCDNIEISLPKTKELIAAMKQLGFSKGLIVVESISHELNLASRNLANIYLLNVSQISPVSLLKVDKILITVGALKKIQERLS